MRDKRQELKKLRLDWAKERVAGWDEEDALIDEGREEDERAVLSATKRGEDWAKIVGEAADLEMRIREEQEFWTKRIEAARYERYLDEVSVLGRVAADTIEAVIDERARLESEGAGDDETRTILEAMLSTDILLGLEDLVPTWLAEYLPPVPIPLYDVAPPSLQGISYPLQT